VPSFFERSANRLQERQRRHESELRARFALPVYPTCSRDRRAPGRLDKTEPNRTLKELRNRRDLLLTVPRLGAFSCERQKEAEGRPAALISCNALLGSSHQGPTG